MAKSNDGRGYGRPVPTYNANLTEVGPGKPMGELMRCYWHPIGLIEDATEVPRQIRVLGEDLTRRVGRASSNPDAAIAARRCTMAGSRMRVSAVAITAGFSTLRAAASTCRCPRRMVHWCARECASPGIR
jgi:hypothetical protein